MNLDELLAIRDRLVAQRRELYRDLKLIDPSRTAELEHDEILHEIHRCEQDPEHMPDQGDGFEVAEYLHPAALLALRPNHASPITYVGTVEFRGWKNARATIPITGMTGWSMIWADVP